MSTIGLMGLLVAFAGVAVSVLCLLVGAILGRKQESSLAETLTWGGHVASILTTIALTVCCGILVYLSLIHISEPTRRIPISRMPSSA